MKIVMKILSKCDENHAEDCDGHFCLVMKTVVKCNVMEIAMKMLSKGDVNHAENFDGHLCLVMKTVMKSNWCYKHRYENVVQGDENHDVNHYYCLSLCFSDVTNLPADLLQKLQLLSMKLSPKKKKEEKEAQTSWEWLWGTTAQNNNKWM